MGVITGVDSTPEAFRRATAELEGASWRAEVAIEAMPAPQRIAPYARAISADVLRPGEETDAALGRLILLHDPAGNGAWDGDFRLVTFARAEIEPEMAGDEFSNLVGWSWLTDALDTNAAPYLNPSGTVTSVSSQSFGQISNEQPRAELEIRASWTPVLSGGTGLLPHLAAWQELLCTLAGLPPVGEGVVLLTDRRRGPR